MSKFVIHYILYTPFITITSVLYTYSLLYVPPKIIKVRIGDADENKLQKWESGLNQLEKRKNLLKNG